MIHIVQNSLLIVITHHWKYFFTCHNFAFNDGGRVYFGCVLDAKLRMFPQ